MHLTPDQSAMFTIVLISIIGAAWLLWLMPSCNEPGCAQAHAKHRVDARSREIEANHAAFHDPRTRPVLTCALCAAARRDADKADE